MLVQPKRSIHQGAVFSRVPIPWLPPPLWVLRPKRHSFRETAPRLADEVNDLFAGDQGEETLVVRAKARPVVVLSPYRELRHLRQVRVVPLYSYRGDNSLGRLRTAIEAGELAGAFHLAGDGRLGIEDGVLRLDQIQSVDSHYLSEQIASLTDAAFASLVSRISRYVQTLDRRPLSA
ncbi:MAG TPA: type II toxin-antitoxin system PemK/MazF family toxin [Candidatus Dormibacteraeota bacterium]|jgi:mRNA-degrading endonuclease toxin of MazEF toxin-antitoxin module